MRDESGIALIAYDGSEDAAEAIRRAGPLLVPRRAVVVRVWDSLAALLLHTDVEGLSGSMREAAEELDADDARDAARLAEEGAELAADAGLDAQPLAVRGKPKAWPAILGEADRVDAAVIVAGCRGFGGVKSALFGSVSSGLLRHSRRPVLVVPPAEDDAAPGPVIVGYDGSAESREAVSRAARLLSVREAIVETVWIPYTPVAGAGTAGAPVPVITRAAEQIDQEIAVGARRTTEEGTRLAAAEGLEARPEPEQEDALEKLILGTERRILLSAEERRRTAYHEAGHAIVAMLTPGADPIRKVSIIPRGIALGVTLSAPEADRFSYDRPYLLGKIKVALGGRVAEELEFGEVTTGAQADIKDITQLARNMVGLWGMSETVGPLAVIPEDGRAPFFGPAEVSPETVKLVDDEVKRLVDGALEEVRALLADHREQLDPLVDALLEHETLDADEAYEAAGIPRPPPRRVRAPESVKVAAFERV